MIRTYLLIVLLGAAGGALAKAGTFLGLLNLEASTTAFLVAVITAAVQLVKAYADKVDWDDYEREAEVTLPGEYNAAGELVGPPGD